MWSVDVQQQLNVGSGFWGLVLNLTLWSCSRQRGLNASLQLLHTSCSPNVFHSSQTQAGAHTDAHSKTRAAALRTETPRTVDHFRRKQGPLSRPQHWAAWSFLRPTLTSSPTNASMREGTTISLLACLGGLNNLATRTGTPWWACVGIFPEELELELELGSQEQRTKFLHPACHLTLSLTVRASACRGPVSYAKGRRWRWIGEERPRWGRRGVWRRSTRPLMLWRGAPWWTPTRGCRRWRSCEVPSSISKDSRPWCPP